MKKYKYGIYSTSAMLILTIITAVVGFCVKDSIIEVLKWVIILFAAQTANTIVIVNQLQSQIDNLRKEISNNKDSKTEKEV